MVNIIEDNFENVFWQVHAQQYRIVLPLMNLQLDMVVERDILFYFVDPVRFRHLFGAVVEESHLQDVFYGLVVVEAVLALVHVHLVTVLEVGGDVWQGQDLVFEVYQVIII